MVLVAPNPADSFRPFTAKVSRQLFPQLTQNIGCAQVIHVMHACYGVPCLLKGNRISTGQLDGFVMYALATLYVFLQKLFSHFL